MKKEIIFLLGLVLLSGCTGGGTEVTDEVSTSQGQYGLVIDAFSTDYANIDAGDTSTLTLSLINYDNAEAKGIYARIYAVGMDISSSDAEQTLSGIESNQSDFFQFDISAPDTLNIDRTFTPYVKVCYNYTSTAATSFFVVDNAIARNVESPALDEYSDLGPVQVIVEGSATPIRVEVSSSTPKAKTVTVNLNNLDVGFVTYATSSENSGSGNASKTNYLQPGALLIRIPHTTGLSTEVNVTDLRDFVCDNSEIALTGKIALAKAVNSNPTQSGLLSIGLNTIADKDRDIYCTNWEEISFGSSGTGTAVRLGLEFDIDANDQDVVFIQASLEDYRYCITSPQIEIIAHKII